MVGSPAVDKVRLAELIHVAQTLQGRVIHDLNLAVGKTNQPMNRDVELLPAFVWDPPGTRRLVKHRQRLLTRHGLGIHGIRTGATSLTFHARRFYPRPPVSGAARNICDADLRPSPWAAHLADLAGVSVMSWKEAQRRRARVVGLAVQRSTPSLPSLDSRPFADGLPLSCPYVIGS